MAYSKARDVKKTDGFLNLKLKTSNGEFINLQATEFLYNDTRKGRSILNAFKANPEMEFNIIGTVVLAEDGEQDDFAF